MYMYAGLARRGTAGGLYRGLLSHVGIYVCIYIYICVYIYIYVYTCITHV